MGFSNAPSFLAEDEELKGGYKRYSYLLIAANQKTDARQRQRFLMTIGALLDRVPDLYALQQLHTPRDQQNLLVFPITIKPHAPDRSLPAWRDKLAQEVLDNYNYEFANRHVLGEFSSSPTGDMFLVSSSQPLGTAQPSEKVVLSLKRFCIDSLPLVVSSFDKLSSADLSYGAATLEYLRVRLREFLDWGGGETHSQYFQIRAGKRIRVDGTDRWLSDGPCVGGGVR
jgi:hypothetical protein